MKSMFRYNFLKKCVVIMAPFVRSKVLKFVSTNLLIFFVVLLQITSPNEFENIPLCLPREFQGYQFWAVKYPINSCISRDEPIL